MPGALKTTTGDQKKSNDDVQDHDETPMSMATLQAHKNTNPSDPRTNYNVSGSPLITGAQLFAKEENEQFVCSTTIDDGGTMVPVVDAVDTAPHLASAHNPAILRTCATR